MWIFFFFFFNLQDVYLVRDNIKGKWHALLHIITCPLLKETELLNLGLLLCFNLYLSLYFPHAFVLSVFKSLFIALVGLFLHHSWPLPSQLLLCLALFRRATHCSWNYARLRCLSASPPRICLRQAPHLTHKSCLKCCCLSDAHLEQSLAVWFWYRLFKSVIVAIGKASHHMITGLPPNLFRCFSLN